jgi:peptidoglycan/LPS O-acetylase OafA/YrhL
MSEASYGKGSHLEAMRGIAALIVVASHLVRAFSSHQLSEIWVGKPWFVFINGEAAVTFFFVLSGYVLTLRPLRSGDPLATVRGVIKRWPRLAGPVLVATVLSCLLWNLGAYHHLEAAAITGSQWLATFATGFPSETAVSDMSLIAAIEQGTWRTFIYGDL